MINIYEGALRLSKAKLYKSPYKETIDKVWEILKTFKIKSQLNFLRNLRTLEIELVNSDDVEKIDPSLMANYHNNINKIYLKKDFSDEVMNENLSHELFHMASNGIKKTSNGVTYFNYMGTPGKNLNEGITEYLSLKSMNKKESSSGYQMELFVIEFLVFIFGKDILVPYFDGNSNVFFNQFQKFGIQSDTIFNLDKYLKKISERDFFHEIRLTYLCLVDLFPDILKEDIESLKGLRLSLTSYGYIKKRIIENGEKLKNVLDFDIFQYQCKDIDKQVLFDDYILEYKVLQKEEFGEVLDSLMEMGLLQNISKDNISKFIRESLFYKDESFKELYTSVIDERLGFQEKKR